MAKRKRVGFFFSYNENWIGGTYYILNIIKALNTLPKETKPVVVIVSEDKNNVKLIKEQTNYPYVKFIKFPKKLNLFHRVVNKATSFIGFKIFDSVIRNPKIDLLYPHQDKKIIGKKLKKIYWIPDFQEEFLPSFFSNEEIAFRKSHQKFIAKEADLVVFSSNNAKSHFLKLYPKTKTKQIVLNFAVSHPNLSELSEDKIIKKHKLPNNYFFSPNQFWAHKNHILILKAVKILKEKGVNVFIAFSGKDHDYRNKDYVESLKKYIKENKIEENISFLGFLDRKEQLVILKKSIAVVQPSLFEGWSTVVEDAKALNKFLILSDLEVHKEQVQENCSFFDRTNEQKLADLLEKYFLNDVPEIIEKDYQENINKFGRDFINLFE